MVSSEALTIEGVIEEPVEGQVIKSNSAAVLVIASAVGVLISISQLSAQQRTTVCEFNSGPRAGTRFDFGPLGVQGIPVGAPCHDGAGSTGLAVAGSGSGGRSGGSGGAGPNEGGGTTFKCRFSNGPRAGTTVDYSTMGVQPVPIGAPCQDGVSSYGVGVR